MAFVNIGFGNMIGDDKIIVMITPDSAPAKRIMQKAKETNSVVDATQGRKTRAVIVTSSDTVVLSALTPETIAERSNNLNLTEKGEND